VCQSLRDSLLSTIHSPFLSCDDIGSLEETCPYLACPGFRGSQRALDHNATAKIEDLLFQIKNSCTLAAYPTLRAEDFVNAWLYARSHSAEIDSQIQENEAG